MKKDFRSAYAAVYHTGSFYDIGTSFICDFQCRACAVWVSMAVGSIVIFIPGILYCLVKKLPLTQAAGFKKTRPVNFLMAFIVLVCSYPVIVVLNMLSMFFVENAVQNSVVSLLMTDKSAGYASSYGRTSGARRGVRFPRPSLPCVPQNITAGGHYLSALFFALMHG